MKPRYSTGRNRRAERVTESAPPSVMNNAEGEDFRMHDKVIFRVFLTKAAVEMKENTCVTSDGYLIPAVRTKSLTSHTQAWERREEENWMATTRVNSLKAVQLNNNNIEKRKSFLFKESNQSKRRDLLVILRE